MGETVSAKELKQQFLSAKKPANKAVFIPEVGDGGITVYVIALTAREKDQLERSMVTGKGKDQKVSQDNIRARYCERCMVDAEGQRLFEDGEAEAIGNLPAVIVDRVFKEISALNSTSDQDVEELAKNSARDRSDTGS